MCSDPEGPKLSPISSRLTHAIWLVLGAALLAWLIVDCGARSIVADLVRVGPGIVAILALDFAVNGFHTLGWWFTLAPGEREGTYHRLFWVRSAGSAVSESTPSASFGGEPAKIMLLRDRISAPAVTASLFATKTCFASAQAIFVVAGMAFAWSRITLDWKLATPLLSGFLFIVMGVAIFAALQLRGIGNQMLRALRYLKIPDRWMAMIESSSHGVDARLSDFYRARKEDLLCSIGAHLCSFAFGILQVVLLLGWLGLGYDPTAAVGIEAFSALVSLVAFAIPASLGIQEGGKVLIFAGLGMPRSAAMAVGITFRLVSTVAIGMGFVAGALLAHRLRNAHHRETVLASTPRTGKQIL